MRQKREILDEEEKTQINILFVRERLQKVLFSYSTNGKIGIAN